MNKTPLLSEWPDMHSIISTLALPRLIEKGIATEILIDYLVKEKCSDKLPLLHRRKLLCNEIPYSQVRCISS